MSKTIGQQYPIRTVSEMTGVNPVTLRAWQRRYGLINPQRTDTGHRLYSDEDISTINTILAWLDKGVAIRNVKALLSGQQPKLSARDQLPETEQIMDALAQLQSDKVENLLNIALKEYPLSTFKKRLFAPLETAVKSKDRPHRGLQYALWRTLFSEQVSALVSQQRKHNRKLCWLLRCGQRGHTLSWLTALELCNQGYRVQVIDGIQEALSPFVDLIDANQRTKVVVVGEEKIKPAIIKELQRLPKKPELVGSIARIHNSDFR